MACRPRTGEAGAARRARIVSVVKRLQARETHNEALKAYVEEIKALNVSDTQLVVNILTSVSLEQRAFARRVSVRCIALLASAGGTAQTTATHGPCLAKILQSLHNRFKDPDSAVRRSAAEALGLMAAALASSSSCLMSGSVDSNPILDALQESLSAPKKEVQETACEALSKVAAYTEPLTARFWRGLLQLLDSPYFKAKAALIASLAHIRPDDQQQLGGLAISQTASVAPYLPDFIGQLGGPSCFGASSGILKALSYPDWSVRKAAAECLWVLVQHLGPHLDIGQAYLPLDDSARPSTFIALALEKVKYDRIQAVRDVVRQAAGVLASLQVFLASGLPVTDWSTWLASCSRTESFAKFVKMRAVAADGKPLNSSSDQLSNSWPAPAITRHPKIAASKRLKQAADYTDEVLASAMRDPEPACQRGTLRETMARTPINIMSVASAMAACPSVATAAACSGMTSCLSRTKAGWTSDRVLVSVHVSAGESCCTTCNHQMHHIAAAHLKIRAALDEFACKTQAFVSDLYAQLLEAEEKCHKAPSCTHCLRKSVDSAAPASHLQASSSGPLGSTSSMDDTAHSRPAEGNDSSTHQVSPVRDSQHSARRPRSAPPLHKLKADLENLEHQFGALPCSRLGVTQRKLSKVVYI